MTGQEKEGRARPPQHGEDTSLIEEAEALLRCELLRLEEQHHRQEALAAPDLADEKALRFKTTGHTAHTYPDLQLRHLSSAISGQHFRRTGSG
jgi:hypothetical protein